MTPLVTRIGATAFAVTVACVAHAQSSRSHPSRPDPAHIEHGLRAVVRVSGAPDTTFDIRDRLALWHIPAA
jgi:hypothetical protein